jgi:hypothetical protein
LARFLAADGQLQGGFTPFATPDRRPAEQAPAQCLEFAFFQLTEPPLEQDAKIEGGNGQVMHCLGSPKVSHRQTLDPKLLS